MYEAGRESAKKSPSPLLWVVCFYLDGEDSQVEDESVVQAPTEEEFTDEQGKVDRASYIRALREWQEAQPEEKERSGLKVSALHYRLTSFVAQRKLEAQMLSAHGLLPGNKAYDEQPAWKWNMWSRYWAGENDERERSRTY